MKHIFIINPKAGTADKSDIVLSEIENAFTSSEDEYFAFVTEHQGHATELTSSMCGFFEDEVIRFYACGGLGTACEVLNGIKDFDKNELAVYPIGLSNDIIAAFPGKENISLKLENLVNATSTKIDIIRVNELYAINHVCFGLDAMIGAEMNKLIYRKLGLIHPDLAYLAASIMSIPNLRLSQHQLNFDGKDVDMSFSFGVVMNGCRYGGSFHPRKNTNIFDGILNSCFSKVSNTLDFIQNIRGYQEGVLDGRTDVCVSYDLKTLRVRRTDDASILLNFDGEITNANEINLEVLPLKLNFVLPEVANNEK